MSQPSNESRISNLEKEVISLGSRIEEGASDTAEELKAIRQSISAGFTEVKQELVILTSFREVNAYLEHVATKEDLATLETRVNARFDKVESTMATKDDIAELKATQEQILKLLQQKG